MFLSFQLKLRKTNRIQYILQNKIQFSKYKISKLNIKNNLVNLNLKERN